MTPARRREIVCWLQDTFGISQRRGCRLMELCRASARYRVRRHDQSVLVRRIREIAASRVRYGYLRIYVLLRREGWKVNRKRVYPLYKQEGLSLRFKKAKKRVSDSRVLHNRST